MLKVLLHPVFTLSLDLAYPSSFILLTQARLSRPYKVTFLLLGFPEHIVSDNDNGFLA